MPQVIRICNIGSKQYNEKFLEGMSSLNSKQIGSRECILITVLLPHENVLKLVSVVKLL